MKRFVITALMISGLVLAGCEEDPVFIEPDPVPATPQGVFSVTGDGVVWVVFNGIYEHDVAEYIVLRSLDANQGYVEIGRVSAVDNPNLDLIVYDYADNTAINGVTYYYAVASVDFAGQVSELSAETVFDTPRPEGTAVVQANDVNFGNLSGFSFANSSVVDDESILADFYVDRIEVTDGVTFDTVYFINAGNLTEIYGAVQDMGHTADFDVIGWAPQTGWSILGYSELLLGHTYVLVTQEGNYAKVRIRTIDNGSGFISFDWAYQTDVGNPELSPALKPVIEHRERPDKKQDLSGVTAVQ